MDAPRTKPTAKEFESTSPLMERFKIQNHLLRVWVLCFGTKKNNKFGVKPNRVQNEKENLHGETIDRISSCN